MYQKLSFCSKRLFLSGYILAYQYFKQHIKNDFQRKRQKFVSVCSGLPQRAQIDHQPMDLSTGQVSLHSEQRTSFSTMQICQDLKNMKTFHTYKNYFKCKHNLWDNSLKMILFVIMYTQRSRPCCFRIESFICDHFIMVWKSYLLLLYCYYQ